MQKTEVLIIGAGIAGLFTALNLKKSIQTLILEKKTFPPDKLCGGLFCKEAYNLIEPLSPPDSLYYSPQRLEMKVWDRDNTLNFYASEKFRNLKRVELYRWLAEHFSENISIRDNTRVVSLRKEGKFVIATVKDQKGKQYDIRTRALVGAGGFYSMTRKTFFPVPRGFIHSIQYTFTPPESPGEGLFFYTRDITRRYFCWLVPRNGRIILGTAMEGRDYLNLPRLICGEWGETGPLLEKKGHPITRLTRIEEIVLGKDNLLLVGEAAGLVRPTSGEGMSLALQSAVYAAQALNKSLAVPARQYTRLCAEMIHILDRDRQRADFLLNPENRAHVWGRYKNNDEHG